MKKLFVILLLLGTWGVQAQEYEYSEEDIYRSPVRAILNKFSFTVSTGYNAVSYKHDLSGFYLIQSPTQQLIAVDDDQPLGLDYPAYSNWLNNPQLEEPILLENPYDVPYPSLDDPVLNPNLVLNTFAYNGDSLDLGFKRTSWAIPLNLRIRYNYQNLRVGVGISLLYHKVNSLKPTVDGLGIRNYEPDFSSVFQFKYYGMVGYKFLDFWDYSFAGELEFGKTNLGSKFNKAYIDQGMYFNLGLSVEKNLSEYFRIIVKPSYDFRSFNMSIPGSTGGIKNANPSFNLNFGVSITIPEIPRSPMKSDHVQLKHVIVDPQTGRYIEVRGQPIWKVQNPKVGQNHRKLERYKFKNRRKMNPY
ncbi:hypothetical protein BFP72_07525 [Reichenbachiella sp. 5M10]|uniref:hypothetical protein n=1 Tax=Reichenbachiella sp. 5M10 TaxID=1889772 RepID=UPI000C15C7AF|nr:hypothetical protein [Reichenbachiella sp. 5M10]PIB35256.1 hypothetical protein BFP72_07525 [Reichenbachiella sp. 5M10]